MILCWLWEWCKLVRFSPPFSSLLSVKDLGLCLRASRGGFLLVSIRWIIVGGAATLSSIRDLLGHVSSLNDSFIMGWIFPYFFLACWRYWLHKWLVPSITEQEVWLVPVPTWAHQVENYLWLPFDGWLLTAEPLLMVADDCWWLLGCTSLGRWVVCGMSTKAASSFYNR
jgi:hypothetical protein